MRRFLHSGKYGDLIYALWTIKALDGGSLLFNISKGSLTNTDGYKFCKPLLDVLPYIHGTETIKFRKEIDNNRGEKLFARQDIENPDLLILDNAWYWRHYIETYHWIYRYAYTFGVVVDASTSVIKIIPDIREQRQIIVQYTDRYKGSRIPNDFLNLPNVRVIEDNSCANMLEMAKIIGNSQFFIGNQSVGAALAQALQHPRLIEIPYDSFWHDAYPIGSNGFSFSSDENFYVELEKVTQSSKEFWS